jgi:hypothetical protein
MIKPTIGFVKKHYLKLKNSNWRMLVKTKLKFGIMHSSVEGAKDLNDLS